MSQAGATLNASSSAVYKGANTQNGTLLKLHSFQYTRGYSKVTNAAGTDAAAVKFGWGVFYNAASGTNQVFAGAPTVTGASSVFAGIIVREPGIANSNPALGEEVQPWQNGEICQEGYLIYKTGKMTNTSATAGALYPTCRVGYFMAIAVADGEPYFITSKIGVTSGDIVVGEVVGVNPDDSSVTVRISRNYL